MDGVPLGEYGIRIAAVNTSLRKVTMVDAEPFFIVDNATSVNENQKLPENYELYQNYPNPANPSTKISFGLPRESDVSLKIYNALGEEVTQLVNQKLNAGYHEIEFNDIDLSSGIYFYRLHIFTPGLKGDFSQTKKMILLN